MTVCNRGHEVSERARAGYCITCVLEDARQRTIEKGEGWRYGVRS